MQRTCLIAVAAALLIVPVAIEAWDELHPVAPPPASPSVPDSPPAPAPAPAPPTPTPCPHPSPKPWGDRGEPVGSVVIDGPTHAGQTVQCDLPVSQRIKNIGSHVDGAGMCVMSSIEMAARYAGLEQMRGLRDWCAKERGGGYPSKTDDQIKRYCAAKSIPIPPYAQYTGPADMAALRAVLAGNRVAAVTYDGHDGVRYRGTIAHMTCCVSDAGEVAILDNNYIQDGELLWMPESDFQSRWGGRDVWLFVWLAPGACPSPK